MAVDRDYFLNRYEAMQAEAGMTDHVRGWIADQRDFDGRAAKLAEAVGSGDPAATMKARNATPTANSVSV